MKTYIGTKIIQAEPAFRIDGEIYPESGPVPRSMNREEGYRVHYPDGYESWSPKGVFEQAYLPMTVNPDLRTDAPSISQQMVDDFIRRQRPAAHLRHVLPQQRAGAPQHTGADTHRAGRVVQLDGKLFHRLPPQPAGHCTQQSDSRLAIKSLSIDGNINT